MHLKHTIAEFEKTAISQEEKGIEKYGKPLNPIDNYDWLDMADEEAVDLYKYLHAEKVKRKFIANQIREVMRYKVHPAVYGRVDELLNELEGRK